MGRHKHVLVLFCLSAAASLVFSGCADVKSYIKPDFMPVTRADLKPVSVPGPVDVSVRWQTDGVEKAPSASVLQDIVRQLELSGCFTEVNLNGRTSPARLEIMVNNYGKPDTQEGSAYATGLTLGLAGTTVVDFYAFSAKYTSPQTPRWDCKYEHAIITTIGAKSGPKGLTPMPLADAIDRIVEQLVCRMLKDMQDKKAL